MRVEYFYSKKRKLDFLKIHNNQQTIYIDGYGVAMLSSSKYADPVIEYIRVLASAIMLSARRSIWGNALDFNYDGRKAQ
jgi:hypothetical protein